MDSPVSKLGRRLLWFASEAGHYLCWMGACSLASLFGAGLLSEWFGLFSTWDWMPGAAAALGAVVGAFAAGWTRLWARLQRALLPLGIATALLGGMRTALLLSTPADAPGGLNAYIQALLTAAWTLIGALVCGIAICGMALRATRERLRLEA